MSQNYFIPERRIFTKNDLQLFCSSKTYEDIVNFICMLNDQVQGISTSETCHLSQVSYSKYMFIYLATRISNTFFLF